MHKSTLSWAKRGFFTLAVAALAVDRAGAVCSGKLVEVGRGSVGGGLTGYDYEIQNTSNPADPNCRVTDFHIIHGANNSGQPIKSNACQVPNGWSMKDVDDPAPLTGDPTSPVHGPVNGGDSLGGFRIISDDANPTASDVAQGTGYRLSFADGSMTPLQDNASSGGFHAPRHSSGTVDAVTPADPAGSYTFCSHQQSLPALSASGVVALVVLLGITAVATLVWKFKRTTSAG